MHGILFVEFEEYVVRLLGPSGWNDVLVQVGAGAPHLATETYPDEQMAALVAAVCERTGKKSNELLEDFGCSLAPALMETYSSLIEPHWKTLDVIEHAETTIHRVVRLRMPGASPPALAVQRVSADEIRLVYSSKRRLCALAKGISVGLARIYGESIVVEESRCMHRGAEACHIAVRRVASPPRSDPPDGDRAAHA